MKTKFVVGLRRYYILVLSSLFLITSCTAQVLEPTCSPDEKQIAFITDSLVWGKTVYSINKGSKVTKLETKLDIRGVRDIFWSPDGKRLALNISKADLKESLEHQIYIVDLDGIQPSTYLAKGIDPSWSPDGKIIAFISNSYEDRNWNIYRINTDGSGQFRLTSKLSGIRNPSWSTDGKQLIFSASDSSRVDLGRSEPFIYIVQSDGKTKPRRLIEGSNPVWNLSGSQFAFYNQGRIKIMNIYDNKIITLPKIPGGFPGSLSMNWKPDGSHILVAVAYCIENKADCTRKIYLVKAYGSEIPEFLADGGSPGWLQGGKIIFENQGQLYSIREDGSSLVQLR